jgi:uncharacterized protein with FMN-binding domain
MPIAIIVAVLVIAGVGIAFFAGSKDEVTTTPAPIAVESTTPAPVVPTTPPTGSETVMAATYKDGTYTKSGDYTSPAGAEVIDVTVTLAGGIVTDASVVGKATNPGSVANQKKFADGFKEVVVGKKIDEISMTVVNGSSLTPAGFMEALGEIKTEAKA